MQNKAKAQLFGFSINASYFFTKNMQLEGVFTYTKGKFTDPLNGNIPLDHVPPVYGKVSFKQSAGKWNTELYALFNGWKKLADYNPNGEDNLQYATVDGMPSWMTCNARLGFQFNKKFSTQVLLENIFDKNYRYFASGMSAPGRNCSITLRASF
jgi:hemoglobin/transferrin/lactoferrin receptor protein